MERFIVIKAGKDELERKFQQLLTEPEIFTDEEFRHLAEEIFKECLTLNDKMALLERRTRKSKEDPLANKALLAIMHGNHEEFERLLTILDHRKRLGLLAVHAENGADNDGSAQISHGEPGDE